MNAITTFDFRGNNVRTVSIDRNPWFVGKDVATVLGYTNPRKAIIDHVDEEDKGVTKCDTLGGTQNLTIVNESGLYSLILSSKLPTAKDFKRWVTSEVLPTIRKTGGYVNNEDDFINTYFAYADDKVKEAFRATLNNIRALNAKIEKDKPKVLFADAVAASHTSILVGDLSKLIRQNGVDIGQNRLFGWMRENGYLCSDRTRHNTPTQRSMNMGLFEVKESTVGNPDGSVRIVRTTKVTGKGQAYFVNLFLNGKGVQT